MDLFTILGASLRRWYVTLPVVALAAFVAWQSYHAVPSVYSSSVSITVLPPVEPPPEFDAEGDEIEPYETNPYNGPNLVASVLARNINSGSFQEQPALEDTTVEADPSSREPIIEITASAATPDDVMSVLDEVTAQASVVLDQFQADAGATEGARYRVAPAVPADTVEDVTPSRFRSAGAIAVIGVGLAAALATATDMTLEMRRNAAPQARRDRSPVGRRDAARRRGTDDTGSDDESPSEAGPEPETGLASDGPTAESAPAAHDGDETRAGTTTPSPSQQEKTQQRAGEGAVLAGPR